MFLSGFVLTLRPLSLSVWAGPEGLGFTVVTRDSSVHGPGPILVKNILPRGAAIKDGRLQSGDRIVEVTQSDMLLKSLGLSVKLQMIQFDSSAIRFHIRFSSDDISMRMLTRQEQAQCRQPVSITAVTSK